jgi:hypothetical protein
MRSFIVVCLVALPVLASAQKADSGTRRHALVELYTSEGCSSCPPAEAWLRAEEPALAAASAIPIELHVDYWNEIGWVDAYSSPRYTERQHELAQRSRGELYTPELALNGREARGEAIHDALAKVRDETAPVLRLESVRQGDALSITVRSSAPTHPTRIYVAVVESGITVDVRSGENAGRKLRHDHVVRTLQAAAGANQEARFKVSLSPSWRYSQLGLVAFAEDERSGEVLQAVALDHLD